MDRRESWLSPARTELHRCLRPASRAPRRRPLLAAVLGLALSSPPAAGQIVEGLAAEDVPRVPHTDSEYTIDGRLADEIWSGALTFDLLIETNPRENAAAPVQTRGYLVENGSTLLVAFDAKDSDPELLFSGSRRRLQRRLRRHRHRHVQ